MVEVCTEGHIKTSNLFKFKSNSRRWHLQVLRQSPGRSTENNWPKLSEIMEMEMEIFWGSCWCCKQWRSPGGLARAFPTAKMGTKMRKVWGNIRKIMEICGKLKVEPLLTRESKAGYVPGYKKHLTSDTIFILNYTDWVPINNDQEFALRNKRNLEQWRNKALVCSWSDLPRPDNFTLYCKSVRVHALVCIIAS